MKPLPYGFAEFFTEHGDKVLERSVSASHPVIRKWKVMAGGPDLKAQRRAVQRTGRKAGGRHAPYSPQEGRTDDIGASTVSDSLNPHNALSGACGADLERA